MTQQQAQQVVAILGAAFASQLTRMGESDAKAWARVYAKGLEDLDFESTRSAVDRLVKTARFLPTIAEIRAAVVDVNHGSRRAGGAAWEDVRAAMSRYGAYRVPGQDFTFDDPIVAQAVKGLGWKDLCLSENSVADRARFIELYDQLARGERTDAAASPGAVSAALPPASSKARELVNTVQRSLTAGGSDVG